MKFFIIVYCAPQKSEGFAVNFRLATQLRRTFWCSYPDIVAFLLFKFSYTVDLPYLDEI